MITTTVRISPEGADWVKQVMQQLSASQSVVLRALFAVGTHHPDEVTVKVREFKDSGFSPLPMPPTHRYKGSSPGRCEVCGLPPGSHA